MSLITIDPQLLSQALSVPNTTIQQAINTATQQTQQLTQNGKIFQPLILNDDIKPIYEETVTSGLWVNNISSLTQYFTASGTSTQKQYYYNIIEPQTSQSLFSVAYGHRFGSGSFSQGQLNDSPTRAIYSQYKSILLEPSDQTFTFNGGINSNHIYVIAIDRSRIKERLDAGNWQINLAALNGTGSNAIYTGSAVQVSSSNYVVSLIDDSGASLSAAATPAGKVYNIVSGSIQNGIFGGTVSPSHSYGLVYPDLGIMVLNADKLNSELYFNTVTASFTTTGSWNPPGGDNARKLLISLSGSAVINSSFGFQGRSEETVKSQVVFVRVKNSDFNFSNNSTFTTGSSAQLAQSNMIGDPKVYITTVGLYNKNYELVAVAKLSKPLLKSFNRELLIRVKLDY